jgi:hypothetical protein
MASQQEIWAAADGLVAAGERPTLAAVRQAVGGGSFTTISEAMKTWHAQQATLQVVPHPEPAPEAITRQIEAWAASIWGEAFGLAQERLQSERAALEAVRVDMERERTEAAELADSLSEELDRMQRELDAERILRDEKETAIAELMQEVDQQRTEAAQMREKAALLEGKVAGLEHALERIATERTPVKAARDD